MLTVVKKVLGGETLNSKMQKMQIVAAIVKNNKAVPLYRRFLY